VGDGDAAAQLHALGHCREVRTRSSLHGADADGARDGSAGGATAPSPSGVWRRIDGTLPARSRVAGGRCHDGYYRPRDTASSAYPPCSSRFEAISEAEGRSDRQRFSENLLGWGVIRGQGAATQLRQKRFRLRPRRPA
jgi:hypothetical protein